MSTTDTTRLAGWPAALVATIAGLASYMHIAEVAVRAGEETWVAYTLPLAIDGLILAGVHAMLADKRAGRTPRPMARLAIAFGVLATIGGNLVSLQPDMLGEYVTHAVPVAVALVPPISFLLAVEVARGRPKPAESPQEPSTPTPGTPGPSSAAQDALALLVVANLVHTMTQRALPPAPAKPRRRTPARVTQPDILDLPATPDAEPASTPGTVPDTVDVPANGNGNGNGHTVRRKVTAADVTGLMRQHPNWTRDQLAEHLDTSTRTLRRVLQRAALTGDTGTEGETDA